MMTSTAALQYDTATGDRVTLRPDDFPTKEERESGFPVAEYIETVQYHCLQLRELAPVWKEQQKEQQLAKENERVLLALYERLPELQEQITPPYGVRLDSGRATGRENWREKRPLEGRRIGGRVYEIPEIPLPVSVR